MPQHSTSSRPAAEMPRRHHAVVPRLPALARDLGFAGLGAFVALLLMPQRGPGGGSNRDREARASRPSASRSGEDARSPPEIPAQGWREIARRTFGEVSRDRVLAVAAGVTFYGLLALFPALAAFVSLYGLVADPGTVADHLGMLSGVMPAEAYGLIRDQALKLGSQGEPRLGLSLALSLLLSVWSANAGMKAIFDALNVAYGEDEKRGFVTLNLVSLGFTAGVLVFALLGVAAVVAVPLLLDRLLLDGAAEPLVRIGRWPVLVLLLMAVLAVLYRFGPSRDQAKWRWVSPGALLASAVWIVASIGFSWYVANFGNYDKTYGTVGAVIGLMMWMWISATIILVGAELNAEAERQTYRDTTKGPPEPIGMRGADVADRKA
ncbi:YihY/virulence factor BrkB family protein [Bosea sp. CS1GBMeth4]|uniref:YihY/virulence factor BrkB family protein n=1 Tax=Bosea sp. CS1GBMeth4 TaxID=1892849 RepID=UPI001FCE5AFA|nr:YihY/virulence factor BrkB family protein [Bosea sp. CS1GBMeth4]